MSIDYSKKVMNVFRKPKNVGELKKYDGKGMVGNPSCGDIMEVFIKVSKNKKGEEIIKDIKIKTFGCVAAIATSDTMATMVKGKTLKEAMKLTNKKVADKLGGLPPLKMHCSNLSEEALHKAIEDYKKRKK